MSKAAFYTTSDVCRMCDIARSTLFRWEREGFLPPVPRTGGDDTVTTERQYGLGHIKAIRTKQLEEAMNKPPSREQETRVRELTRSFSLLKVANGEAVGLLELQHSRDLPAQTIYELARIAVDFFRPADPEFRSILSFVLASSMRPNEL
jgi:DNA-binding transcriptional MerR regulator